MQDCRLKLIKPRPGILPLAVKHYRQTLESVRKRLKGEKAAGAEVSALQREYSASTHSRHRIEQPHIPAVAREAAYNLQVIFLMTGAADLCRQISEEWLGV